MLRILPLDEELYADEIEEGFLPAREGDAGVDLRARNDQRLHVGKTVAVPLDVAIAIPRDTVGWITGRSSTQLDRGLFIHEGKVDSGYRGEIHCVCTAAEELVELQRGDRLCSLLVLSIVPPDPMAAGWSVVTELEDTPRGEGRFGSTGQR